MMKRLTLIFFSLLAAGCLCGCSDEYDDSALWKEIQQIKSRLDAMNADISAMQLLIGASENGKLVLDVIDTGDGFKIIFSDGSDITLNHGKNGDPGAAAPVIGVKEDLGVFYWTITTDGQTEWLTDQAGDRIPVTGSSGRTPEIGIDDENYWTIDGERITDRNGNPIKAAGKDGSDGKDGEKGEAGKDGDSFFKGVEQTDTEVIITLDDQDQTVIRLQKITEIQFEFDRQRVLLPYGQSAQIGVVQTGIRYTSVSKPDGWKVEISATTMTVTAPARPNDYAEQNGEISVVAVGNASTIVAKMYVETEPNVSGGGAGDSNWQDW